jgi:glycosyltransferase involved in cell wall biosynthesis
MDHHRLGHSSLNLDRPCGDWGWVLKPTVSIIVPCRNEEDTIRLLLDAILGQTYPLDELEVVIADGMSEDGTRAAIAGFQRDHPELIVVVVNNLARSIPSGLNAAIEAARGEILARLDAHSVPERDYIARSLQTLEQVGAANVGGIWDIRPVRDTPVARAIAAAAAHPLGAGDARYRISGQPGAVETVPFGTFKRAWIERVGLYDESLLTNEDYELNTRLRKAGGVVWFDPQVRSIYFARGNLGALARQYARYGFWKARMLKGHPETLRWRQALPPLFIAASLGLFLLGWIWQPAFSLLAVQWGAYTLVGILYGCLEAVRRRDWKLALIFPLAIWIMHLTWGAAFILGLLPITGRRTADGA